MKSIILIEVETQTLPSTNRNMAPKPGQVYGSGELSPSPWSLSTAGPSRSMRSLDGRFTVDVSGSYHFTQSSSILRCAGVDELVPLMFRVVKGGAQQDSPRRAIEATDQVEKKIPLAKLQ